jgi:hypothetical protein
LIQSHQQAARLLLPNMPARLFVAVQACERRELQQQQGAFMAEVEQWSQGEVEAIQAAAEARIKEQQQAVEHW